MRSSKFAKVSLAYAKQKQVNQKQKTKDVLELMKVNH